LNYSDKANVRSLLTDSINKSMYVGVSNEVYQYDIYSLQCQNKLKINNSVYGVGIMPENNILAVSTKNEIKIYDTKS